MILKFMIVYLNMLLLPPAIFLVFVAIVVVMPSSNEFDIYLKKFYIKIKKKYNQFKILN